MSIYLRWQFDFYHALKSISNSFVIGVTHHCPLLCFPSTLIVTDDNRKSDDGNRNIRLERGEAWDEGGRLDEIRLADAPGESIDSSQKSPRMSLSAHFLMIERKSLSSPTVETFPFRTSTYKSSTFLPRYTQRSQVLAKFVVY